MNISCLELRNARCILWVDANLESVEVSRSWVVKNGRRPGIVVESLEHESIISLPRNEFEWTGSIYNGNAILITGFFYYITVKNYSIGPGKLIKEDVVWLGHREYDSERIR